MSRRPRLGRLLILAAVVATGWLVTASPAAAQSTVWAFPTTPPTGDGSLPCLPTDPFCVAGQAAGAAVTNVWITAMLALWGAGLWLLRLAFSVIDAVSTPDLSAGGPLAGLYPVTFGIGASLAALMALVQLGIAAARRDGRTLGRLLIGLVQYGLVWFVYVGIATLLVTGVSGLTTGLLHSLLHIDHLAAFRPSLGVSRDLVDGTVATVLGVSSIFLLLPASIGYLLLMLVREAALLVLAATSAISAGGLLAESSSAWFWKSLRWFLAALLVSPVAVLVLGIGVSITEGIVTGADQTGTESAVGTAVVGCLLILLGAICPLALFRLLAFVDPGTTSGAALRTSLSASGGVLGALHNLGGRGARAAGGAAAAASGGVAASGAAGHMTGDRAQGESTADAATSGRFAGAVRALATGSAHAGRLAAGAAAGATDVLASAGIGHPPPYYGQPPPTGAAAGHNGRASGRSSSPWLGQPPYPDGPGSASADASRAPWAQIVGDIDPGSVPLVWPAEQVNDGGSDARGDDDPPAPRRGSPADGGAP